MLADTTNIYMKSSIQRVVDAAQYQCAETLPQKSADARFVPLKATVLLALLSQIVVLTLLCETGVARDLIIGVTHWPPRVDLGTKPMSGIDIEIMKVLLQKLELHPTYRECPFKRCLSWLENGELDIQGSLLRRAERELYMLYIDPPYLRKSTKVFYIKRGKNYAVDQYEDLYQYRIGVRQGYVYFPRFDNDSKLKKQLVRQDKQLLKMLEHDRVDIVIGTENNMDYLIHTSGFRDKFTKAVYRYDKNNPVHFAVSKKSPFAKQLPRLNSAMRELVDEGKVEEIMQRYFQSLGIAY